MADDECLLFLCASQYFCTQSDPAVPRPGKDPDEPSVDGGLYDVLSVCVVVKITLENLEEKNNKKIGLIFRDDTSSARLVTYYYDCC